ncbi:MAG: Npt1/Npt2 family nucleotide transporter [Candidatus Babeliaceae bacterium]|jgi:AAA family ATP:ADP antiporter
MSSQLKSFFKFFVDVEPHERIKVILLTAAFFCAIGGYTIAKELKDSIFVHIVGLEYMPWAKMLSIFILIPPILFYSRLVDILKRSHLLYFYCMLYGIGGLICVYLLGHPTIGLANTDTNPYRLFGWFLYFFIEGYSPFVVSVFWAFTNSITSPKAAKNNYTIMIAGSKFGGMIMSAFAWWLLTYKDSLGQLIYSDVINHQILLGLASCLLLCVPIIINIMITRVPAQYLHGYEAVYKVEKERSSHGEPTGLIATLTSIVSGLVMIVRYPYVMGMFGMIFFWEIINVVLGYLRLSIGETHASSASALSGFLFKSVLFVHLAGFIIVLFGTRALINFLGERKSLILIPTITGILLTYYLTSQSANAVLIVYILIRSVNYAFAYPLRESLYIPTTKEMKFKSKSWIDAFGAKVAKGCGSYYNVFVSRYVSTALLTSVHTVFFIGVISMWLLTAQLLGKRFERAVENNEVIGLE